MTGHTTYRCRGCRIHVTPWVRRYMSDDVVLNMVAAMGTAMVVEATISAGSERGPFYARVGESDARGRTPYSALDKALAARREAGW